MNFGRCEGALEYSASRALPPAPISAAVELKRHGLGPAPVLCARVWPEGAHCLVVQPVPGHETETILAVSRQHPLGLSLGWRYLVWMPYLTRMGMWKKSTSWAGCLCPHFISSGLELRRTPSGSSGSLHSRIAIVTL